MKLNKKEQEGLVMGIQLAVAAAALLMSVRGRLAFSKWPRAFEGVPIALVTVGLLAMAFLGFTGLQI